MKIFKAICRIVFALLLCLSIITFPVYAIVNPDSMAWGTGTTATYNIFENVLESGDWLIAAEVDVAYAATPTDYTASEAFLFELVNTDNTTIVSTTLNDYDNRPISIYLSAARVTALGLVSGTAYDIRVTGNPLVFPSQTGNTIEVTLAVTDYIDQNLGASSDPPTDNVLRNFCILMGQHLQAHDGPADDYLVFVQGYQYLTIEGADIFIEAIPGLTAMCPILFQAGVEAMTSDAPESTGTYAVTLTPAQKWGQTAANGLTALGSYLGINQALAGSVMLFILAIMLAMFAYKEMESGLVVILLMAAVPFLGAWLGLMPLALAFIFVIIIITLLGFFFFSRGAL